MHLPTNFPFSASYLEREFDNRIRRCERSDRLTGKPDMAEKKGDGPVANTSVVESDVCPESIASKNDSGWLNHLRVIFAFY